MYQIGWDGGEKSTLIVSNGKNTIIEAIKFPQKIGSYKTEVNKLKKNIKDKIYKTKKAEKETKDRIKYLTEKDIRSTREFVESLRPFEGKVSMAYLEMPLQMHMTSQIKSLLNLAMVYGINRTLLEMLSIPCEPVSVNHWVKQFDYGKPEKEWDYAKKREFKKQESIRISKERIINIEDYWIQKGCKNIDDNLCEGALLSILNGELL